MISSTVIISSLMQISTCHEEIAKTLTLAILIFEWWMGRQNYVVPKSTLSLIGTAFVCFFHFLGQIGISIFKTVFRRNEDG